MSFSSFPSLPRLAGCIEVRHVARPTPRRHHRALPHPLWSCLQPLPPRVALHARSGPEVARQASPDGLAARSAAPRRGGLAEGVGISAAGYAPLTRPTTFASRPATHSALILRSAHRACVSKDSCRRDRGLVVLPAMRSIVRYGALLYLHRSRRLRFAQPARVLRLLTMRDHRVSPRECETCVSAPLLRVAKRRSNPSIPE